MPRPWRPRAKLKASEVEAIKILCRTRRASQVARWFQVHRTTVSPIVAGKAWVEK
jgi:hypothetical protein